MLRLALLALLSGAPPQGVTVQLTAPRVEAAPAATGDAVDKAVREELSAQGYGVVGPEASAQAGVASKVSGLDGGCLITLTLTRKSDGLILDEERERAQSADDAVRATKAAVRRIASEIRMAWGVRVKVKTR